MKVNLIWFDKEPTTTNIRSPFERIQACDFPEDILYVTDENGMHPPDEVRVEICQFELSHFSKMQQRYIYKQVK